MEGWMDKNHFYEMPAEEMSRVRIVEATATLIGQLFQGSHHAYSTDLPDDAKLVSVHYDPWTRNFLLQFWSHTFDVVPEGNTAPKMNVVFKVGNGPECPRCGEPSLTLSCTEGQCGWREDGDE